MKLCRDLDTSNAVIHRRNRLLHSESKKEVKGSGPGPGPGPFRLFCLTIPLPLSLPWHSFEHAVDGRVQVKF